MIPHVRRVVAGGAGSVDRRQAQSIVEARHAANRERMGVEDRLSPGHGFPRLRPATRVVQVLPGAEQGERIGIERCSRWVVSQRIVDSRVVRRGHHGPGPAVSLLSVEFAGSVVGLLRRKQRQLEIDDRTELCCRGRNRALGMTERRVHSLMQKTGPQIGHDRVPVGQWLDGFPSVPHHCAEEA